MSGPWDRPSSDDPGAGWPSEDLEQSSGRGPARDPGTEGAPGWDDWPPAPPPPDDYLIEEPLPPSSDPWAESWTEEEADAMLRAASGAPPGPAEPAARDPWTEPTPPPPDGSSERAPDRWDTPEAAAPDADADAAASAPEPVSRPEPEPEPEPQASEAQRTAPTVEPWSPDPDPWRFDSDPEPTPWSSPTPADEPAQADDAAAVAEPPTPAPIAEPDHPAAPERDHPAAPELDAPRSRWPARTDELPDWLAEPEASEPDAAEAVTAEPDVQPAAAAEPDVEPPAPADGQAAAAAPVEEQPAERPGSFWDSILPWRSAGGAELAPEPEAPEPEAEAAGAAEPRPEPEAEPVGEPGPESVEWPEAEHPWLDIDEPVEPAAAEVSFEPAEPAAPAAAAAPAADAATEPVAEPEAAPKPAFEPRWPASVPEPLTDAPTTDLEREGGAEADADAAPAPAEADTEATPPEPEVPPAPSFVPIGGGLRYEYEAQPQAAPEPEPLFAAPEPQPEFEPEAAVPVPQRDPEPEVAEPEPIAAEADRRPESDWSDRGESTQVLPTDWTPSQPEPPRTGELQPEAGPIRIRLAQPDVTADAETEQETAPTTAEQAVPWLIGVILLLAGMVIVLLALIFAGEGSLGGSGSEATPSPNLAVAPGAGPTESPSATPAESQTPSPTSTEPATPTPEPTPTAAPVPEYGPLEMVYQGRSAALAPIYLLRRDFTLDQEPTVLAQDADFDVRRFAWAPDGTVGAGLLSDILVSIEPGQEKRRLGDGLSTVTFGDDASTVFSVRITEDGADDVATVLAVDFGSGDTEELASVTYERPEVGDEAPLSDAQFTDDGGAVRLYWMADDMLRLWVVGAGTWTIDPADGEITELDGEPLPTLVAPNGRDRIELAEEDGTTTLTHLDMNDRPLASATIDGTVSHLRWSPAGDRVVFTLGRSAPGGGVLQDLYLWDLDDEDDLHQLTSTGAAFGAEWLGAQPRWRN